MRKTTSARERLDPRVVARAEGIDLLLRVRRDVRGAPGDAFFRRLGSATLRRVKGALFEKRAEVSLVFCGNAAARRLNRLWRGKNRPTDVLSFPQMEGVRLAQPKSQPLPMGDVVINLPTARRQAKAAGKPVRAELALLWVHGLLHLAGYDHAVKSAEKRMFALQDEILGGAGRGMK